MRIDLVARAQRSRILEVVAPVAAMALLILMLVAAVSVRRSSDVQLTASLTETEP